MNSRDDLFKSKSDEAQRQDEMAQNVARLKSKKAKQNQVHLLCQSLVKMIKGK